MHAFYLLALFVMAAVIPLFLYRVIKGPTVFDRLIGLNGIATKAILFLVIIGAYQAHLDMFLDIALGYGLINLIGSVAAAKYLEERGFKT
ncbi:MAG: pH regulation protein F [Candidatus Omnitrophica bacterium]|nr:pH regulation protein F [Candidatus Omnitrophota bacterium]